MNARQFGRLLRTLWLGGLAAGALIIGWASRVYFDAEEVAPFVIEKLPLPHEDLWQVALEAHVLAACFALPACLLLSLEPMLRFRRLHRWLGRATGVVVLAALVPSGLYLSLFAKGGVPSTLGFVLSGLVVALAMVRGMASARARNYRAHQRSVSHVLAQLSVAVTSRALLYSFDAMGIDPDTAYLVALWFPVLAGLVFVEARFSRRSPRRKSHAPKAIPVRSAPVALSADAPAHRSHGLGSAA